MLQITQPFWKKWLLLSILVSLVIVSSIFSSQDSVNAAAAANAETSTPPPLQPIIPFFMNPLQSTDNATAIKSSLSFQPVNESIMSSSSAVNTTNWNSVNTTLGIQFMVPPHWIADQFESSSEGRTTPITRGVNFTSPESDNSFFMVDVMLKLT